MHKEDVIVTPSKRRTTVRTSVGKIEEDAGAINNTVNLHARLPSADSGIQADGGFDSLSRYKGETFLATISDRAAIDSVSSIINSQSSSGYSSDHSQGSLPLSLKPKAVPLSSQLSVAATKPVPPVKPTLTSSPSKSPRSTSRTSSNSSLSLEISNGKPSIKDKPKTSTPRTSDMSSVRCSGTSRQTSLPDGNANQNVSAGKPVPAQRTELSTSVTSRKLGTAAPVNHKPLSEPVNIFPGLKVVTNDNSVEVSFSKSAISVSSHSHSSTDNAASSSTNTWATSSLDIDHPGDPVKITESSSKETSTTISPPSGTTLKLQVLKPGTQSRDQQDKAINQGQGCIALTRPLRLGAPSKISVKTVQPTALSSQQLELLPVMKPSQQNDVKQQQHPQQTSLTMKPKPKIAPRPSVLAKTVSTESPVVTTSSHVTTSSVNNGSSPSMITNSATRTGAISQSTTEKGEVPVVHRIKTSIQTGRTEIPVTHVVHRASSYKNQLHNRPPSFVSRYTPEREKQRQHQDQQTRQPIYENIRFNIRQGFDFDDADTRMKHAELILKQSDELINDAMKMFGTSPLSPMETKDNRSLSNSAKFSDGSIHVDVDEAEPKREHRIPIFDARTGKLHSGTNRSFLTEWTEGRVASTNGDSKKEVTWRERKERIDSALSWLKHELSDLRDMDNTLISQFKRCQDTIETLKSQREMWEGLSEEGEEGEYWDDYELNEYNRRYLDSPGGSSCSQFSPGSRQPSLQDVTLISFPVPQLNLPQERKTTNGQHGVKQDIEVTL